MVDVCGLENKLIGLDNFRAKPCPQKLLRSHAVVSYKAHYRKGEGPQNTYPRQSFDAEMRAKQKVQKYRHAARQQRKNELSQRQSEKHGFRIITDFVIDFYFQMLTSLQTHHFTYDTVTHLDCSYQNKKVENEFTEIGPDLGYGRSLSVYRGRA